MGSSLKSTIMGLLFILFRATLKNLYIFKIIPEPVRRETRNPVKRGRLIISDIRWSWAPELLPIVRRQLLVVILSTIMKMMYTSLCSFWQNVNAWCCVTVNYLCMTGMRTAGFYVARLHTYYVSTKILVLLSEDLFGMWGHFGSSSQLPRTFICDRLISRVRLELSLG